MPRGQTTTVNIDIEIANYSSIKEKLKELKKSTAELNGEENNKTLETTKGALSSIDKILNLLSNKVGKNGKMTLTHARQLQDELFRLTSSLEKIDELESKRLKKTDYDKKIESLKNVIEKAKAEKKNIEEEISKLNSKKDINLKDEFNKKQMSFNGQGVNKENIGQTMNQLKSYDVDTIERMIENASNATNFGKTQLASVLGYSGTDDNGKESIEKQYQELKKYFDTYNQAMSSIDEKIAKQNSLYKEQEKIIKSNAKELEKINKQGVQSNYEGSETFINHNKEFTEGLNNLEQQAVKTGKSSIDLGNSINTSNMTIGQAAKTLAGYRLAIRLLRKVLREAINTIKQMDEALTGMTVVTGKSREEVNKYIPTLRELANATSSTMTEVASLTTEYLRQGRSMKDALTLTEQTAQAAKISGLSTADTITYMTAAINGFNLAAEAAESVSDVFANVAAKSATSYEQLATAISKVSAQANLAGMSLEYTTALLAKGIETTQEAPESVGTALKTVIARMRELTDYGTTLEDGANVNKVESALASAGIELRDETGAFRDLNEIFNELGPKWDNLNTMQQQAIAQAVAGTRQQSRFVAIMQDWNRTLELVTEAEESAGAAAYQYSQYAKGMEATMERLTTGWQGIVQALTSSELIIGVVDKFGSVLNTFAGLLEKGGNTVKTIFGIITGIVAYSGTHLGIMKLKNAYYAKQIAYLSQIGSLQNAQKLMNTNSIAQLKQMELIRLEIGGIEKDKLLSTQKDLQLEAQKLFLEKGLTVECYEQLNKKVLELGIDKSISGELTSELIAEQAKSSIMLTNNIQLLSALLFNKQITVEQLKQYTTEHKGLIANLLVLLYSKLRLKTEKNITEEQKEQLALLNKQSIVNMKAAGKMIGRTAAFAALAAIIAWGAKCIYDLVKAQSIANEKIEEYNNELYELTNSSKSFDSLVEEYNKLSNAVSRTAEEEERLNEIQEELDSNYGISGENINGQIEEKKNLYKMQELAIENKKLEEATWAFNRAGNELSKKNLFENSNFANAFSKKYKIQFDSNISEEVAKGIHNGLSEEQGKLASSTGQKLLSNVDNYSIIKQTKSQSAAEKAFKGYGGWMAGATSGVLLGAAVGSFLGPIGTAVGGILGGIAGGITGVAIAIKHNSQAFAKKTAAEYDAMMYKLTEDITNFSKEYSKTLNGTLEDRMAVIQEAMNNGTEELKTSLEETFGNFLEAMNDTTLKSYLKVIETQANKEGKNGANYVEQLIDQYNGLGNQGLKDILQIMSNDINNGGTTSSSLKDIYGYLSDTSNAYYKEAYVNWEASNNASINAVVAKQNQSKNARKLEADRLGINLPQYDQQLAEELAKLNAKTFEDDFLPGVLSSTLKSISTASSVLDFKDVYTGMESSNKNIKEIISNLKKGEMTMENFTTLSSQLVSDTDKLDEIYSKFASGDYDGVQELLYGEISDSYTNYLNELNKFMEQQDAIIEAVGSTEEEVEAAKNQKKLTEMLISYYVKFNDLTLKAFYNEQKLARLEESKNDGNLKAYDELIELKEDDINTTKKTLSNVTKNYGKEADWIEKIYRGTIKYEDALKEVSEWTDEEQTNFKQLYENTKDYYSDLLTQEKELKQLQSDRLNQEVSLQNEAVELVKSKYQEEQDALKKSLDTRKQMYQDYFNALEEDEKDEDYATKRSKLVSAISRLSASSDAQSLSLLKEYQQELQDLDKEYNSETRSRRLDAINSVIDEEVNAADEYYSKLIDDTKRLWDEYSNLTQEKQIELFESYKDGFASATREAKNQMWSEYATMINNIKSYTAGDKGYIDPTIQRYANGGMAYGTGLAWLDGTSTAPEAVLTAEQTNMLLNLANGLTSIARSPNSYSSSADNNSSVTIEALNISLSGAGSDTTQTGYDLAEAFMEGLRRTGININKKA